MDFLFGVRCLTAPLVQEIVFLASLNYDILQCLKPPYFIPKGSVPIENHAGHNLAAHAKLGELKWFGVPPETCDKTIQQLIQQAIGRSVTIERTTFQIIYTVETDRQQLWKQNHEYKWKIDWVFDDPNKLFFVFNDHNRLCKLKLCYFTNIQSLNVLPFSELRELYCECTNVDYLDLSNCSKLQTLQCDTTMLQSLDISKCLELEHLDCSSNRLTKLNVGHNSKLEILCCASTEIETLDLSSCTQLAELFCSNTNLTELNVSNCPNLEELSCENVLIKEIDVENCKRLHTIEHLYYHGPVPSIINYHKDTKLWDDVEQRFFWKYSGKIC